MNIEYKKIIYSMHPLMRKILPFCHLENIEQIAKESKIEESVVTTAIQLLEQQEFANYIKNESKTISLDKFGEKFLNQDLPEIQVLKSIKSEPKLQNNLDIENDIFQAAIGVLKRYKLIEINKTDIGLKIRITNKGIEYLKDNLENPLKEFEKEIEINKLTDKQKNIIERFKQRKGFLKENIKKTFSCKLTSKGKNITKEIQKNYKELELLETLDTSMLKSGSWKNKEFRHYDLNIKTNIPQIGRRHPTCEANNILRDIFVEMGFNEMQGPMVESAFWNMDLLWIPQDHPARDEQDTYYLEGECEVPTKIIDKVKNMHEVGINKSHTPKGEFKYSISKKKLLRTHSTATSFRILSKLSEKYKKGENINGKYFYIANNFRNEAIDATHLAEFFQAEGIIIGDNLSLADLMGFVKEYYKKLGITKIKFKPTFNPYTEPSMEAHYYDPTMKKWYALINSGIFRPETLEPLGLENKTIIGFGMGASRVATLLTGAKSMRDITGYTCDFEWLKTRKQMQREIVKREDKE